MEPETVKASYRLTGRRTSKVRDSDRIEAHPVSFGFRCLKHIQSLKHI